MAQPDSVLLLAQADGALIGYALAHVAAVRDTWIFDTWVTGERIAEIESLSVLPGHRGKGLGSALMDELEREISRARRRRRDRRRAGRQRGRAAPLRPPRLPAHVDVHVALRGPMSEAVLAIDLGTGGPKVALVDRDGVVLAREFEPNTVQLHPGGGAEQRPADWWSAITTASRRLLAGRDADVRAVAITGQWAGTVALDEAGEPLGDAVIWLDTRGAEHARTVGRRARARRRLRPAQARALAAPHRRSTLARRPRLARPHPLAASGAPRHLRRRARVPRADRLARLQAHGPDRHHRPDRDPPLGHRHARRPAHPLRRRAHRARRSQAPAAASVARSERHPGAAERRCPSPAGPAGTCPVHRLRKHSARRPEVGGRFRRRWRGTSGPSNHP